MKMCYMCHVRESQPEETDDDICSSCYKDEIGDVISHTSTDLNFSRDTIFSSLYYEGLDKEEEEKMGRKDEEEQSVYDDFIPEE